MSLPLPDRLVLFPPPLPVVPEEEVSPVLLLEAVFCSRALARSSASPRAFSDALEADVRRSPAALDAWVAPSFTWPAPSLTWLTPSRTPLATVRTSLMLSALPSSESAVPTAMMPFTTSVAPLIMASMPAMRSMMAL